MFKNREGTGRRKLCCEQGWWGTGTGQGRRHSPYICSAPMREKAVRPRGGYVTALRANMRKAYDMGGIKAEVIK